MLVSFSLRNYKSFESRCTLEMMPGYSRSKPDHIVDDCLKIATIYGANASGKSNLIQGLGTLKEIVTDVYYCGKEPLYHWGSNDTVTEFEIEFIVGGYQYRYQIGVDSVGIDQDSPSKCLFVYPVCYERLFVTDPKYEADRDGNLMETLVFEQLPDYKHDGGMSSQRHSYKIIEIAAYLQKINVMCSGIEHYAPSNTTNKFMMMVEEKLKTGNLEDLNPEELQEIKNKIGDQYANRRQKLRRRVDDYKRKLLWEIVQFDHFSRLINYRRSYSEQEWFHVRNVSSWFSSNLCILDTSDIYLPELDNNEITLESLLNHADLGIEKIGWFNIEKRKNEARYSLSIKDQIKLDEMLESSRYSNVDSKLITKSKKGIFKFTCRQGKIIAEELRSFRGADYTSNIYSESDGTVRLIELISILIPSDRNMTFVVDELDRRLHPLLVRWFIETYLDDKSSSKQLIFTTHDTGIMTTDLFRKDEMWFVDRDNGQSHIRSLDTVKYINYNKRLERLYLDDKALPGIPKQYDGVE